MPLAPRPVMSASAATWLSLSTSLVPAAVSSSTFSSPAVVLGDLLDLTQNGFVLLLGDQADGDLLLVVAARDDAEAEGGGDAEHGETCAASVRPLDDERAALAVGAQVEQRVAASRGPGRHRAR